MRAFTFRGTRVRVTTHNLIVARDLTYLLFGPQSQNTLSCLPVETVVSVPRESLTGDSSDLKPSVRFLNRDGAVHLMDSARYPPPSRVPSRTRQGDFTIILTGPQSATNSGTIALPDTQKSTAARRDQ